MKKSHILGLSAAALASNLAMVTSAEAVVSCTATTTTTGTTSCTGSGGYTADTVNFVGSAGVVTAVSDTTAEFAACSYHLSGSKSFGMTTAATTMTIRTATGKGAAAGSGCAA